MKRYLVRLEAEERARLEQLVRVGKAAAYRIRHANILLAVDESEACQGRVIVWRKTTQRCWMDV